jgi:hypothetical protein
VCQGLRAEQSSLTAPQKSAEGIAARVNVLKARPVERRRRRRWSGERASGEASDGFDAWDERAAGATGEDAPVRVCLARWLELPNRRIHDPNVRWCGRGGREVPPYPDKASSMEVTDENPI